MRTPQLRENGLTEKEKNFQFFCFDSGKLETKNAGWREKTPVVSERCVGCGRCYLYCPDGVIRIENKKAVIDYDFCKGCGICKKCCPAAAIDWKGGGSIAR